ncbi:MAG: hypothetical protein NXH75_12995 [Halobacteriovoraceae bacterium]|nr:hypothetical protein [Halobacteriovoraceae bacterium]
MTFLTSLSLAFLAFFLSTSKDQNKVHLLYLTLTTQVISLGLLSLKSFTPNFVYFQASALPTSLFIILGIITLFFIEKKWLNQKLIPFVGPLLLLVCIFFTYAFIGKKFFLLGFSQQKIGVGLSLYTLIAFYLLSFAVVVRHTRIIHLYQLKIGYQPVLGMITVITYATTNYLLTFCESKGVSFISLLTQLTFIGLCYWFFFHPFHLLQDKFITICSWSRQVKDGKDNWLEAEELFNSLGLTVTHGISEEHYKKVRERQKPRQS